MPERKRTRPDQTPSPPDQQTDPAKRPPKQIVTSTPAPQRKPPPVKPPPKSAQQPSEPARRSPPQLTTSPSPLSKRPSPSDIMLMKASTKPPPQERPAPRQSATLDASDEITYRATSTQGGQERGFSGYGPGYGQSDPRHTLTGSSALGSSAQQPSRSVPESPYGPNAPPREARPTDWTPYRPPHVPGSSRSGPLPPPIPPNASGEVAMDPPQSHRKQHRGGHPHSPSTKKAEETPLAPQSQSEAPQKESEDELLRRFQGKYKNNQQRVEWHKVSKSMKAEDFDRSADWCVKRWQEHLDPDRGRDWSLAEDEALKTLKEKSINWEWEVISSQMAKQGFYRSAERCKRRWQEAVRPQSRITPLSHTEVNIFRDLRSSGSTFPDIIDALEHNDPNSYQTQSTLSKICVNLNITNPKGTRGSRRG